jgi:hypothetical protein
MGEPWEHLRRVPMVDHVRRSPLEAFEGERSIAAGEQALQAVLQCVRESAGTLEAHEAEQGLCKRRLPMGLAAMPRSFAPRGTGEVGPAVTRADGGSRPREQTLRGRDDCSLVGTCAVPRTCYRTAGEPGICPLDAPVNLPERCDSYGLQAWMTMFAVAPPVQERTGCLAPRFDLEVAESVLMAVAQEAPQADEAF